MPVSATYDGLDTSPPTSWRVSLMIFFFTLLLTGGPFKCPTCVGLSEEECNRKVYIVTCGEGLDRCLATRHLGIGKGVFERGCGNEAIFEQEKIKCAAKSCEVSMCSESYCVA